MSARYLSTFFWICFIWLQSKTVPAQNSEVQLFHLEEKIRFSGEDNDFFFGSINEVAIGKDGAVFIADNQFPVIRMFDDQGTFMKQIGREGRGPDEYHIIGGLETLSDGKIVLWDQRNNRVNYYSKDGEYIESRTIGVSFFEDKVFEIGLNGNFYFKSGIFDPEKREIKEMIWVEYSRTGEPLDTLYIPRETWADKRVYVLFTNSGNARPFTKTNVTAIHQGGFLVTGNNVEYSLKRLNSDSPEIHYSRKTGKVKVKSEEVAQWKKINQSFRVNNPIPDVKPYFKSIKIDADGRIWVWKYVEAERKSDVYPSLENSWWEQPTYDVFLESGEFYGTVKFPWNVKFKEAIGGKVWASTHDENGEPILVQYHIVKTE